MEDELGKYYDYFSIEEFVVVNLRGILLYF